MDRHQRPLRAPTVGIAAHLRAAIAGLAAGRRRGAAGTWTARLATVALVAALSASWGPPTPTQARPVVAAPRGVAPGDIIPLAISAFQAQAPNPGDGPLGFAPLVADKETMVRVWVAIDGSTLSVPRDVTVTLTAQVNNQTSPPCQPLYIAQTKSLLGIQAQGYTTLGQYRTEKLVPDLSLSFTFQLPSWCWWLDAGTIQLTATATGDECPTCGANNVLLNSFTFYEVRKPIVLLRPIGFGIPAPDFTLDGFDAFTSRYRSRRRWCTGRRWSFHRTT